MTHIELTIQDIEHRVDALMKLRDQLRDFMVPSPLLGKVVLAPAPVPVPPAPSPRKYTRRAPEARPTAKPAKIPSVKPAAEPSADGSLLYNPATIGAVRKLPEPFSAEVLTSNGIIGDHKRASNFLNQAKYKGWLTSAGRGLFKRTSSFGGQVAPSVPAATAPAEKYQDKVSRLELLKQRDASLSANA